MSINQMKTVNNIEGAGEAMVSIERANNYTSFHTNKQTSFRQSYAGTGNTSKSNIAAYNHYTNINNYSSLTNSSSKPAIVMTGKDSAGVNALKIARKDIKGISKR